LSLVIPGAGQIYKGQIINGLVWLLFVVGGYIFFIIPGLVDPYK
jgi:TM2 domain-containing membrane protein YozV